MKSSLRYKDLPQDLKDEVELSYGNISRSQNPTINHIIKVIKECEKKYLKQGFTKTSDQNRMAIDLLEEFLKESLQDKSYSVGWERYDGDYEDDSNWS